METRKNTHKILVVLLLIIFSISACVIPIKVVNKKAAKFNGKKVRIRGRVISSIQLKDIKCFTIKDKTGKICIVTNNLLPLKRDFIKIKGKLNKNYKYKKQQMIVVEEKQMKLKKVKFPSEREIKKTSKKNIK